MRLLTGVSNVLKVGVRKAHFLDGLPLQKRGIDKIEKGYFNDKTLLVYFSSSWCPSCQLFTPKLKRVYEDAQREKLPLEVLWICIFRYYNSKLPPFVYFPFGSVEIT
ncbi:hypothetical protein PMAYCL1PPCAC_18153 [Pristionchus mayeri]|uniref:protein-disulfide reductase n=1 Tax=Pristionchus mayeri TaxID=1317129 RepID=A0AAN5CNZ3_9BILA|nr:hypothetical protein PMAYCL1PPCAC_18153 [Pristionchus mayeri]